MSIPEVSVVMSVYNGAEQVEGTLTSILSQQGCDFEFIVVNDGSTDDTGQILDDWAARDERLRIIHQKNTGLTRALIRGCAEARGELIARQDCGDISLPGRLAKQLEHLKVHQNAVAVSSFTRFIGPMGEHLFDSRIDQAQLEEGLLEADSDQLRGPSHHGSVMMRQQGYKAVGGYRPAFYFAQDLDLWSRLVEQGRFLVLPHVLYQAKLEARSITGMQTQEQRKLAGLIFSITKARRSKRSEKPFLDEASQIRPVPVRDQASRIAKGNYFIGSCLLKHQPKAASRYFREAIALQIFMGKAWVKLALSLWRSTT